MIPIPQQSFPRDYVHCMHGNYLDAELNPIDFEYFQQIAQNLPYPVIKKLNCKSYGGKMFFCGEC